MFVPPSSVKEITWPALPSPQASSMLGVQHQLEQSQWYKQNEIMEQQFSQLATVLSYAKNHVPYYKNTLNNVIFDPKSPELTLDMWRKIPVLKRSDIQSAAKKLFSTKIPREHGKISAISTSGSTGKTIKVAGSSITNFFWQAFNLRDHYWHQRVLTGKQATIKLLPNNLGERIEMDGWGPSTDMVYKTGKSVALSIKTSIDKQVDWLLEEDPDYLLTYPSNVLAISAELQRRGERLKALREVRTLGETVSPQNRKVCQERLNVPLVDIYSCQEAGYLALQCPKNEHYHVQSENVFLEILDDNDMPVKPGETGRVIVTTLHNFVSPLIRYEIGDYAESGDTCDCGRGLPVIKQIKGRVRNLVTFPNGTKAWPVVGSDMYDEIAPVKQFQFIQKTPENIEVKLVVLTPLSNDQESKLKVLMKNSLGYDFNLEFTYQEEIPRSAGGKYEDFISLI